MRTFDEVLVSNTASNGRLSGRLSRRFRKHNTYKNVFSLMRLSAYFAASYVAEYWIPSPNSCWIPFVDTFF